MPIKGENMAFYPGGSIKSPEWQAIRAFMRARAGDRCEECGVRHLTYGVRIDGGFTDLGLNKDDARIEYDFACGLAGLMGAAETELAKLPPMIRIVCTVAHVDQELVDHSTQNLRFWCQQCHLRHDAKSHAVTARRTRIEKSGQVALL